MPERSALTEVTQIGVEGLATPGTAVAATRTLRSFGIRIGHDATVDRFRPDGQKYETIAALTAEHTKGTIDGRQTYDELVYLLASAVANPTISTVDTSGRSWVFKSATAAPDSVRSYTVERGSSVRAHKAAGHIVTDLTLSWNRKNGAKVSGSTIGKLLTDAITLSAGTVSVDPVRAILMDDVSVKIADTKAGLTAAVALDRVLNADWKLTGRQGPVYTVDASQASYAALVEQAPACELTLKLGADANGMAPLTWLRGSTNKWVRIQAISPDLAGAATAYHSFQLDMYCKVAGSGDYGDDQGIVAKDWMFTGVPDATLGGPFEFTVVNTLTAL